MREPFNNARLYLTLLLNLQILMGIAIVSCTIVYYYILSSYMDETQRELLAGQFVTIYIFGFQLIFTYYCSITMWQRIWNTKCSRNIVFLIKIWLFFSFIIVASGSISIWMLFRNGGVMDNMAETSLLKGIDKYYSCPDWKLLWDGMQYRKQCCGVHSYKDWMNASWMPDDANKLDAESCTEEQKTVTLVPYACCRQGCAACFENYVPQEGKTSLPFLGLDQINTDGCLRLFSQHFWELMFILLFLMIFTFKIFLIVCCYVKFLLRKQDVMECGCQNLALMDEDDGRPLVIVKCPANVRCVALEDEDGSNPMTGRCNCQCQAESGFTIEQDMHNSPNSFQYATQPRIIH